MVGSLMMSSNGNGDSDKQACVLSILKEIKSYESGTAGDEEAVESLLLLGSQPSDTLDAVDGLLHLNTVENGFGKRHCNGAVLPVVSVSDLGDLLDDVVPSIVSNGGTTLTCSLQSTLTSLGPLPEDLLLGPDLHLSSPTKARQLLRSIEDDAC
uniref:Uncharacterized protein n=1 Tax=Plectus sambesii TaxID=2011161 RepID=A0A914WV15_9BILA